MQWRFTSLGVCVRPNTPCSEWAAGSRPGYTDLSRVHSMAADNDIVTSIYRCCECGVTSFLFYFCFSPQLIVVLLLWSCFGVWVCDLVCVCMRAFPRLQCVSAQHIFWRWRNPTVELVFRYVVSNGSSVASCWLFSLEPFYPKVSFPRLLELHTVSWIAMYVWTFSMLHYCNSKLQNISQVTAHTSRRKCFTKKHQSCKLSPEGKPQLCKHRLMMHDFRFL